ncbi:uncharacterized protein E0L32_000439 [Thyridium curvatum]|uniref:NADP-dependent oxidoreductase domain-containing protein n=1 Tax=Thyridium curvatum TaxID=1093900 RepID=A0A507ATA6_9PEZI|nr:uncharacterized protein E0L32_000439 [Thyridium curvatum]TPX14045.1 hypothetical protein E0L32_000439 [Thyridium curvatum]
MEDRSQESRSAISNIEAAKTSTVTKSNPVCDGGDDEAQSPHNTVGIHSNISGHIVRTLNDTSQNTVPDPASDPNSARLYLPTARYSVRIPLLCVGAAGWGSTSRENTDEEKAELDSLRPALAAVQKATGGLCFIDAHPGRSEDIAGKLIASLPSRESFVIQARFSPNGGGGGGEDTAENTPRDDRRGASTDPVLSLKDSLARLGGLEYVDIYLLQIQKEVGDAAVATDKAIKQMAECVEQGLARVVGIAGPADCLGADAVRHLDNELAKYNIPLAAAVPEWNPARPDAVAGDLVAACREVGAVLQAGTMVSGGPRVALTGGDVRSVSGLLGKAAEVAGRRADGEGKGARSAMATALNYVLCKGAVPTLEFADEAGARDLIRALGWKLDDEEVREIDEVYA